MALKNRIYRVEHIILDGDTELLNGYVADRLTAGWELLDSRVIRVDYPNRLFTVFYIFIQRDGKDKE